MIKDLEDAKKTLDAMRHASAAFYAYATVTDHHRFIEFTGFLNEYIKICSEALESGVDLRTAEVLPMKDYQAAYIGEKMGCIFGSTFVADSELLKAFLACALGNAPR